MEGWSRLYGYVRKVPIRRGTLICVEGAKKRKGIFCGDMDGNCEEGYGETWNNFRMLGEWRSVKPTPHSWENLDGYGYSYGFLSIIMLMVS